MPPFLADPADIAACGTLLRGGSRSFFAASLLLPARVRGPATALYAFCRVADDAVDLGDDPQAALALLHERLNAAYDGRPHNTPVDRAFAATITAFEIPKGLPAALIEGLGWDAIGRRYETFAQLLDYAARVAGAVGVMMALVMGARDAQSLARAADLGVAMQLTNIARDVGEDARADRFFLPADWCAQAGLDVAPFLTTPIPSDPLRHLVARLLHEAQTLYARAQTGIAKLPVDCRIGIAAAGRIYAAIGANIADQNFDSITRRARVSGKQKFLLAGRATMDAMFADASTAQPPLPANVFLLQDAVVEPPPVIRERRSVDKLLDMFERLERLQRTA